MALGTSTSIDLENLIATKTMTFLRPLLPIRPKLQSRLALGLFLALLILIVGYPALSINNNEASEVTLRPVLWKATKEQADIRVAKATVLYERSNTMYERALKLHEEHNVRFGYEMHVLRSRIVKGGLNKFLCLQQLIVAELQKPVEEQVEWILYFDPTVILWNNQIPLDVFLPPVTDFETFKTLSIIATKPDGATLSSAVFFVRVSGVSLRILTLALAHAITATENELGADVLATALQHILEQDQHRDKAIYQPAAWYNSTVAARHAIFKQSGGRNHIQKLLHVEHTLQALEAAKAYGESKERQHFRETENAQNFWGSVTQARRVLGQAKDRGQTAEMGEWRDIVRETRDWVELRACETEEVMWRVQVLMEGLEIA